MVAQEDGDATIDPAARQETELDAGEMSSSPDAREEATMAGEPSAARKAIGDIAPNLADITDQVLFGDIWERPGLSRGTGAW